jgi:hypothetical protein
VSLPAAKARRNGIGGEAAEGMRRNSGKRLASIEILNLSAMA